MRTIFKGAVAFFIHDARYGKDLFVFIRYLAENFYYAIAPCLMLPFRQTINACFDE